MKSTTHVTKQFFGKMDDRDVHAYTFGNKKGIEVTCLDYGCVITKIMAPDVDGVSENIVLGFDDFQDYLEHSPYFGSVVGRVAGRIRGASFELNGKEYDLPKNDGENHLHGGPNGFWNVVWEGEPFETADEVGVKFSYRSRDGEEGYPGHVDVSVTYSLNNDNELNIIYAGTTDQDTLLNLTNHSYFNLSGDVKRDILQHELKIASNEFLELDEELLPTGKRVDVTGTAFDFRNGQKIEAGVKSADPQNKLAGNGYDHPFLLTGGIELTDSISGRKLTMETDQPSVVVYTSNMLEGDFQIRGVDAENYLGICLETQYPPDAIHHSDFPSIVLKKGEEYKSQTTFRFGVNYN
ncbi:aldose epimerase family protein [Thalassobacillus pellis]|uniref:aldose epimerase family protein n=1 Tax=Thalassobacillus pellis TaxID=748008 RepID=UPI0019610D63|nr:aldose epimerase family protein [Thalassobacillus pellis]MBM7551567.1 aldose 1-epimerase [Thalassobacillus pellis]